MHIRDGNGSGSVRMDLGIQNQNPNLEPKPDSNSDLGGNSSPIPKSTDTRNPIDNPKPKFFYKPPFLFSPPSQPNPLRHYCPTSMPREPRPSAQPSRTLASHAVSQSLSRLASRSAPSPPPGHCYPHAVAGPPSLQSPQPVAAVAKAVVGRRRHNGDRRGLERRQGHRGRSSGAAMG